MMRFIGVRDFARDINENVHSASLILDSPIDKETRWDILALYTIIF
jgi:hypothetical protein